MQQQFSLKEGNGDFYFGKATSSGNMPDMHAHPSYEIFYLTSGSRKFFVGDKYYQLKVGDFACIPLGAQHKTGGDYGQRLLINFSQAFIDNYLTKDGQKVLLTCFEKVFLRPALEQQNVILELFNSLKTAYETEDFSAISQTLFKLFIILSDAKTPKNEQSFAIKQLHSAMQYVKNNFEHITCLDDVANALFISKYYICHLFSKFLEVPFNEYLTQTRLENAKNYLKTSNLSVCQIALKCGFNSSAYFSAVFKKYFNVTPVNFRKLHSQNK